MDSSDSLSNNICRRLVNFILRMLRRPSSLPCSTHQSLPCSTHQVPVEEGSSRNPINRPNGFTDSEIAVEFNHINGSERNEHVGPVLDPLKDGLIVSNDESKVQNVLDRKALQEREALARKKGLKKTVTIKGSEKKNEGDQSASDQTHGETKPSSPRPHWPLLCVDPNINEKSDAYIERKKKDMVRNYGLDPDKKSS